MRDLRDKYESLKKDLRDMGSVAAAFSGGVDSAFLLYAAKEALGEHVMAVTACSAAFSARETEDAKAFCRRYNIRQELIPLDIFQVPGFEDNPPDRCYHCKKMIFARILSAAAEFGMNEVIEGSNLDDEGDYRPGHMAIAELKVKSPLRKAGFTKAEIRALSKELGLPTWNKPSCACLASRFPYGERITAEGLSMVERAEDFLRGRGFGQVRVRIHGKMARIELLPSDMMRMMKEEMRKEVFLKFREIGFTYAALDLMGYRTGSMNEELSL